MSARKQLLLKRHRKNKRIALLIALVSLLLIGVLLIIGVSIPWPAWCAGSRTHAPFKAPLSRPFNCRGVTW